jgi:acyl-CoA thioesterase-1
MHPVVGNDGRPNCGRTSVNLASLLGRIAVPVACMILGTNGTVMAAPERIVFLGDSITDGHTYPLLIQQALREAGRTVPVAINAGVGGDTAKAMRVRLERDVLPHRPTLVTLSVGINDTLRSVAPADYRADVTAIADRLQAEKIPLMILTTSVLGAKHTNAVARLADYNAFLRDFARQRGLRLADVYQRMEPATGVLEPDESHPNFAGQRLIARAVLDALGHRDVPVPEELKVELMPGVIRKWQVRALPDGEWKDYRLPEPEPQSHSWHEQERRRGFALSLEKVAGTAKQYEARTTFAADRARTALVNTGAHLQVVRVNGTEVYRNAGWTGWHAGKERVAVRLKPGENELVIITGPQFFLSVTETDDW